MPLRVFVPPSACLLPSLFSEPSPYNDDDEEEEEEEQEEEAAAAAGDEDKDGNDGGGSRKNPTRREMWRCGKRTYEERA